MGPRDLAGTIRTLQEKGLRRYLLLAEATDVRRIVVDLRSRFH